MIPSSLSVTCALYPNSTGLPRRPLAIGRASGSCRLTSRVAESGLSPASRSRVWATIRPARSITMASSSIARRSRPWTRPVAVRSARRALRSTADAQHLGLRTQHHPHHLAVTPDPARRRGIHRPHALNIGRAPLRQEVLEGHGERDMWPLSAFVGQVLTPSRQVDDLRERIPLPLRGGPGVTGRGR